MTWKGGVSAFRIADPNDATDLLEGVVFADGTTVVRWIPTPSTVVWESFQEFWDISVVGHRVPEREGREDHFRWLWTDHRVPEREGREGHFRWLWTEQLPNRNADAEG